MAVRMSLPSSLAICIARSMVRLLLPVLAAVSFENDILSLSFVFPPRPPFAPCFVSGCSAR